MNFSKLFTKSVLSSLFLSVALGLSACGQSNPNEPLPACGNGSLEDGEQCDDGDNLSGDGCSKDCEIEEDECGDSTLNAGEQCDDGNTQSGDGCDASCEVEGPSEAEQIDEYVEDLGTLNQPTPLDETPEGNPTNTSYGPYGCSTQNFHQIKVIDSFKVQGGALQEAIYPGMLLSGASLAGGNFEEVIADKKTLTLSHDVGQLSDASIPMQDPSTSSFAQARTDLLVAQLGTQTFTPEFSDILVETSSNKDELSLSLGVDVSAGIATEVDVASKFDFNSTTTQSRYLIRLVSELYTMKIDPVSSASDYFAGDVTLEQVKDLFPLGTPPVYVDTVTYGREVYIMIESNFSERELELALDAAVSNVASQVDVTLDFGLTSSQVLQESKVVGIAVGPIAGDIADLGNLTGANAADAISKLATREVLLSKDNLGQPISFTTRYLPSAFGKANSIVDATYPRETCSRLPVDFSVDVDRINVTAIADGNSSDAEVRGTIKLISGQNSLTIFSRGVGQEVPFSVGGFTSPFLSGSLDNVDTTFNVGNTITVEFSLTEDDRLTGDNGNGQADNSDDPSFVTRTITIEELYQNGGQVKVPVNSAGGMSFDLFINFTPSVDLVP